MRASQIVTAFIMLAAGARAAKMVTHDAIVSNGTHRFFRLRSEPSFGQVNPQYEGQLLTLESVGVSQCGADPSGYMYIGSPPAECTAGKHFAGTAVNGYVEMLWSRDPRSIGVVSVRYPGQSPPVGVTTRAFFPFNKCWRQPDPVFKGMSCAIQPDISYYIDEKTCSVWLAGATPDTFLSVYSVLMVVLLAILAIEEKIDPSSDMAAVSSDMAFGGALFHVYRVGLGQVSRSLEVEVGADVAMWCSTAVATFSLAFATLGWITVLGERSSTSRWLPAWVADGVAPLRDRCMREVFELPLLLSIPAMWPESVGVTFRLSLAFACGICTAVVCGRAAYRVGNTDVPLSIYSVAFCIAGVVASTVEMIPAVSQSECAARGQPSIIVTAAVASHMLLCGWVSAAYLRLSEARLRAAAAAAAAVAEYT